MARMRPNPFYSPFDKLRANGSGRAFRIHSELFWMSAADTCAVC